MNKDLTVFTGALLLVTVATGFATVQFASPSFMVLILTVLSLATWLVYYFVQKGSRENFIRNYLLTIVLKLLSGGTFILILLHIDKLRADANAIFFMTVYLLLTVLEVGFLFRKLG